MRGELDLSKFEASQEAVTMALAAELVLERSFVGDYHLTLKVGCEKMASIELPHIESGDSVTVKGLKVVSELTIN